MNLVSQMLTNPASCISIVTSIVWLSSCASHDCALRDLDVECRKHYKRLGPNCLVECHEGTSLCVPLQPTSRFAYDARIGPLDASAAAEDDPLSESLRGSTFFSDDPLAAHPEADPPAQAFQGCPLMHVSARMTLLMCL